MRRPRGPLLRESPPPYQRKGGIAAVLLYRNGGHRIVWPDRNEDVDKPLFGSPYTVFEVRLGTHVTAFRLDLPAAGDGVFFEAVAKVHWTVTDPRLVVREQVWDVAELLHDELLDALRRITRRFGITEAQRADEAVRHALDTGSLGLGRSIGLRTRVYVFIDLDATVKAEVSRRDTLGVTMEADERLAEAERRRDAAEWARIADRVRAVEALLRSGDLARIAHHVARYADKRAEIRLRLQQERRDGREGREDHQDVTAVLDRLLVTGVLGREDIGDHLYQVLMYLRTLGGAEAAGASGPCDDAPRARPALEEAGPRPDPGGGDAGEGRAAHGGHRDAPRAPRVHEPTRVESAAERREREGEGRGGGGGDRSRERERERDRGRDRDRSDGRQDPDGRDVPHGRGDTYERGDRDDDRRYAYDRDETYDRYERDDPYDRARPGRRRRFPRPTRPGSGRGDPPEE
ncbi:hypothetical protein [Streptomyces sp. NPDC126503]|uniref:hypothetical protein n=1 Tax=Streptomyces sp. NPDC126503 TaxID=3155315 RepID=UPI0033339328